MQNSVVDLLVSGMSVWMTKGVVGVQEALQNKASLGPCLQDASPMCIDIWPNMDVKHISSIMKLKAGYPQVLKKS